MFKDFRKFVLRGNVVDLAVAVVIGASFNAIIQSLVKDFITPLIGIFYKKQQLQSAYFTIHHSKFIYGDFINSLVSFLIIATVVFFFVVQPVNKLISYSQRGKEPGTRKCPECLSTIPAKATRCMYCTSKVTPAASAS